MRNSSLVEWFCAENVTGLKCTPKLGLVSSEQNGSEKESASRRKVRGNIFLIQKREERKQTPKRREQASKFLFAKMYEGEADKDG